MADLSDVEDALVSAILAAAVTNTHCCVTLGASPIRVYRGTPPVTGLTIDRTTGTVDICVLSVPDSTRNTTRWGVQNAVAVITNGLSASVDGQTASFTGTALGGELAGLLVNDQPFVYAAQAGDSAALVASALANLVLATQICWLSQSSITIPGAAALVARTAGIASIVQEYGRQEQSFRITIWAPSPRARDLVCGALGSALAPIVFLTLADGTGGRMRYKRSDSFDEDQVASIYRRDLVYDVEYGTTETVKSPVLLFGDSDYNTIKTFV